MTTPVRLSDCLHAGHGGIRLDIPDGALPGFLIEAYNAVQAGRSQQALLLLSDRNLRVIHRLDARGVPQMALIELVLAMTFQRLDRLKTAAQWYERVVGRQSHPWVWMELASIYDQLMLYGKAVQAMEAAMALEPDRSELADRYPDYLAMAGRVREAVDLLGARVHSGDIDPCSHSSLLFYLHYVPEVTCRQLLDEHVRWGQMHAPARLARVHHDRDLTADRRLRVGYLSADFRRHSVAYNFEAVLDGRDRHAVEVYGYGSVASPDAVTARLAGKFDHYRSVHGLGDSAVADLIEQDRIDILVALAGHSCGHRLGVLAYKPAPIQVDDGSLAGTGMAQVDYRLTDQRRDPPRRQEYYLEELAYLPDGYVCYRPPEDAPAIGTQPALRNGHVTFGSFNNVLKINDYGVALWSQVLKVVPSSRMLLKFPGSHDPILRTSILSRFERHGIAPERLTVADYCRSFTEHMAVYHWVDIALDTYPFNGGVSTLEALWMGVPVVTLVGDKVVSREGLSLLSQVGMEYLAASSPRDYCDRAAALAGQVQSLVKLRAGLRQRMRTGSLCDGRRHALELEAAYRRMWHRWCDTQIQDPKFQIQNDESPIHHPFQQGAPV